MTGAFEYQLADSWEEAVELHRIWGEDGKILAGGQSLVPMLNLRLVQPAGLIDINPIGAVEPRVADDRLVLSALTRHQDLLRSPLVREHCPILAEGAAQIGNVRVRARGTVGGSMCHADPSGEIPCMVLALDGQLIAHSPRGQRVIDAERFLRSYLTTDLAEDELLTEIRLPIRKHGQGWAFLETVRRYSDFATVEVAATATLSSDAHTVTALRVVVGGVADRPLILSDELLSAAVGGTGRDDELRAVGAAAAATVSPESDVHASADYRRRLTEVLTYRALGKAIERGRAESKGAGV
ncbi:carbon-monoxide dehydrogenase medium subunit/2-furoyl-CoA dehydrogenase FAD binding subunit [Tamaricihabitans halophyticus]|uniref:Carbon-monoxide dehydrogenase medium subunit/2-furoyl-CoA dehydrogenase FAD binding subunit n=1 Tax=Tamaricihabitans halophyticus TaxID=1262583 RepID=A0A4R2R1Z5_9PSEU|nr:xanthine dehydrogenase family protein subunit M [Tamaricihabitans halophyticus]TCP53491.1 carbon-monoxide dehydrogenase medium subunit/2-furoyl-CoA dehydrogenase FAD binding subunit [Tamaricihabitans halophyticus]